MLKVLSLILAPLLAPLADLKKLGGKKSKNKNVY